MDSKRYDAFISYSRTPDARLAKRLQSGLERATKPWYRLRSLRVFRDDDSLSANPDLWRSIEAALAESEWLILLASPEAGRSDWINREVEWWLDNRTDPLDHLLVALTSGDPPWDAKSAGDGDGRPEVLPPALRGRYATEPRWVDLRDLREVTKNDEYRSRLEQAIADLAAPLLGKPKDVIYGETLHQHRRAMRWAYRAIAGLVALMLAVAVAGVLAYVQRNHARAETRVAVSRQLVAEADSIQTTRPDLARQLIVEAYQVAHTDQATSALLAGPSIPGLLRFNGLRATAYSPRVPFLAVGTETGTTLVNAGDGTALATLPIDGYVVRFSADGRVLAVGDNNGLIRLVDVRDPAHPRTLGDIQPASSDTSVDGLAFTPDGHTLASSEDDAQTRLWNIADPARPELLASLPGTDFPALDPPLAMSPDGRMIAVTDHDYTIGLWDISLPRHPRRKATLAGHTNTLESLAFSGNGHTLASGSHDDTVRLWDVTGRRPRPLAVLAGATSFVQTLAFAPDSGTLAAGDADGVVHLWNVSDTLRPALRATLTGHSTFVRAVSFSPDGRTLATASWDNTLRLWDVTDPGRSIPSGTLEEGGSVAAFRPDGRLLATAGRDYTIRLWNIADLAHPTAVASLPGHSYLINGIAFSADGRTLATCGADDEVRLWDVADPARPRTVAQLTKQPAETVAFSPDRHTLALASRYDRVRLWDVRDPAHPRPRGAIPATGTVAFDPRGTLAATGDDQHPVRLWNVRDPAHPKIRATLPRGVLGPMSFGADGDVLVTAGQGSAVRLWDIRDPAHPRARATLTGGEAVHDIALSTDGRLLATAESQTNTAQTIRLWNIADLRRPTAITTLTGKSSLLRAVVAFGPDGRSLAVTGDTVGLWDMEPANLMRRLCTESGNPITPGEWRQYVPGRPFARPCARLPHLGSPLTETSPTGTATPSAPPGVKAPTASAAATPIDLHRVAWSNASVPGDFCAVSGEITLRNKKASATSAKWGRVQIWEAPGVTYGDLGGATGAIAAVPVFCDNGGETADSQLAQAYILFGGSQGRPVPVATLTPQQPSANVITVIDKLTIGHGRITAHEIWSRLADQSCCATGRATTVWTVKDGRLVPGTPDITS